MAQAMTLISSQVLGSNTATVTFSNFSGYRDLRLVIAGSMSTSASPAMRLNSDSTSGNYAVVAMWGTGSAAQSNSSTTQTQASLGWWAASPTVNTQFVITTDILDYAQTDKHKTYLCRASGASEEVGAVAGRWASTSAVTTILVTGYNGNGVYGAGSVFSLYGIAG